jgi:hypothetical protein
MSQILEIAPSSHTSAQAEYTLPFEIDIDNVSWDIVQKAIQTLVHNVTDKSRAEG